MPRSIIAALVLIVFAAGGAFLWSQSGRQDGNTDGEQQDNAAEAAALTQSKGLAWRNGPTLNVRMKSGELLALTDRRKCGDLACPKELSAWYRYLGWDRKAGGYRLLVALGGESEKGAEMILPFDEDAVLIDALHPDPTDRPLDQPSPPPAAANDEGLTEWLTEIAAGRRQSEAPRIAQTQGKAAREGANLALALADGRHLTLSDDLACGQVSCPPSVFRSFTFAGTSPDGRFHLVELSSDEITSGLFVSTADGAVTGTLGLPKFSPDGTRAIDSVSDLSVSAPHRLELWALKGNKPVVEYSIAAGEEDDTVYEVVGWADNDHVRLRRGPWDGQWRSEAMLVKDASGWHVEGGDRRE